MIQQSKGKIFLADQRGMHQTACCQSCYTFNYGNYFNEHRQGFGALYLFNDDTLAAGASIQMQVKQSSYVVLIPIAGAIACRHASGEQSLAAAGQVMLIHADKGDSIDISNPFSGQHVNFIQLWIKAGVTLDKRTSLLYTYPDANENLNNMVLLSGQHHELLQTPFTISLGKFYGRGETVYLPKNKNAGLFAWVINGAFEIEGRLLHAADALALWDTGAAEMEALSNDAILLMVELPGVVV